MSVAILRQGDYLIASIQGDLTDTEVMELRDDLTERVGLCAPGDLSTSPPSTSSTRSSRAHYGRSR